jgi:cbb3-type cytochrome oxidase subunit 3
MSKLKDIKPIVTITDDSLIYFLTVVFIMLLAIAWAYWVISKSRRNEDKKFALEQLQKLDFSNSKTTAYDFKKYAQYLCTDDNQSQFEQINRELEAYKYKKQVDSLDTDLIQIIKGFIHV